MVQLYAPQIRALILRRDARIARKLSQTPGEALFEDRRLDVVSECRVSLPQTLAQIAG
jgi:hypothetical protein